MDRRPDRRIIDNAAEVRHLRLLQPVRQHQCLVTRELDRDLAIAHVHPSGLAPALDHTNLLVFDLDQIHRGTPHSPHRTPTAVEERVLRMRRARPRPPSRTNTT